MNLKFVNQAIPKLDGAALTGGKGGGKPDSAMGGGSDVLMLDNALAMVDNFVAMKLGINKE